MFELGGTVGTDSGGVIVGETGGTHNLGTGGRCQLGPFGAPEVITGLGLTNVGLWGPSLSGDGYTVYFGASDSAGNEHIYRARRADRGATFSAAERLSELASNASEGTPCVSADELTIYFYSTRSGGTGDRDLWVATRTNTAASFGTPIALSLLNTPNIDYQPWISADERQLLFTSPGSSAQNSVDIWVATRSDKSQAFPAAQRFASLSSTSNDQRASLSSDGLTAFFSSDRAGGLGNMDIWYATRTTPSGDFIPAGLVEGINSTGADRDPMLSRDDTELVFASARGGLTQLYRVVRTCQ